MRMKILKICVGYCNNYLNYGQAEVYWALKLPVESALPAWKVHSIAANKSDSILPRKFDTGQVQGADAENIRDAG